MMRDGHDGGSRSMSSRGKIHKFLWPRPKLPPPIDPALLKHEHERAEARQNQVADAITTFSGSMWFVYIHIIWFSCWIGFGVESYPYGLLTMIVSLEAIFLSTFVMLSQNRADLPFALLDNQPEPSRREAPGDREPAMADGQGRGQAERATARAVKSDP